MLARHAKKEHIAARFLLALYHVNALIQRINPFKPNLKFSFNGWLVVFYGLSTL